MPHVIVEHSANLEERLSPRALIEAVHAAVLATGVFELAAVRTRAERRDVYMIADGDPTHVFIHAVARIAPGRDAATRKRVGQAILDAVAEATAGLGPERGLALSVEVQEIDDSAALRRNNLHQRLPARAAAE